MSTELKFRLILAALLFCVIGLAAQTFFLWRIGQGYTSMAHSGSSSPAAEELSPIEQKILDSIADKAPPLPAIDPFALPDPVFGDPFGALQAMRQRLNGIFGSASGFGSPGNLLPGPLSHSFTATTPEIRLSETDREYQVHLLVPDSHELELNTEIEGNTLSLSGRLHQRLEQAGAGSNTAFFSQSRFSRTIPLADEVDELGLATEQTPTGLLLRLPKKLS